MHLETCAVLERWEFGSVVCLTGPHGIGKSFTVHAFCAKHGKTVIDVIRERERHDVKWDRIPLALTKKSVCLLDAPCMSAGDGGMASLKRFLQSVKVPTVLLLDPSMLSTFADVCKTYRCITLHHDSYADFKAKAASICSPSTPDEIGVLDHCVRSARRNLAFVINNYRFMIRDARAGTASCGTYDAARPTAAEALHDLVAAPRPMRSIEDNCAVCVKHNVGVDNALTSIASTFAPAERWESVCALHALASDADLLLGREEYIRDAMCALTRRAVAGQTALTPDSLLHCSFRPRSTRTFAPLESRKRPRASSGMY